MRSFQPPGPARQDSKRQRGVKQGADLGEADIIGAGQPNIQASISPDEQCIDDEARQQGPREPAAPARASSFARIPRLEEEGFLFPDLYRPDPVLVGARS